MKLNIRAAIRVLNEILDMDISCDYYKEIEEWHAWWGGFVKDFHTYWELDATNCRKRRRLYGLRMGKKVCEDWASLLLNEKTKIIIDDNAANRFFQGEPEAQGLGGIAGSLNFWDEANSLIEKAFYSGTGAFVLKVDGLLLNSDGTVRKSPDAKLHMDFLPAGAIVPITVEYGAITEVAFVSVKRSRGREQLYIETHMKDDNNEYVITNYKFKVNKAGNVVSEELESGVVEVFNTGSGVPFFSILKPNKVNQHPHNQGLGVSIFADALDNLRACDIVFNNFVKDFRLGGKKVFYDRSLTKTVGTDSKGAPIYAAPDDMMQQLFLTLGEDDALVTDKKEMIYEFNPTLRVPENQQGMQSQLDYLSFKCGFGPRHYRFERVGGNSAITATQYSGEKQELKQNAAKHGIFIENALIGIIRAVLWAGANLLGESLDWESSITVDFSDGYIISDEERQEQDRKDVQDGLMTIWEYRMKWRGEDESTAKLMAAEAVRARSFGTSLFPIGEDGV